MSYRSKKDQLFLLSSMLSIFFFLPHHSSVISRTMERITILLAALSLSATGVTAQNKVGEFSIKPMIGINVSDISGGIDDIESFSSDNRFTGGLEAEIGVMPWLGISLGAMYSQQGSKYWASVEQQWYDDKGQMILVEDFRIGKLKVDYINVPLLFNFYVWKGLALKTGIQMGFLVNDKLNAKSGNSGIESDKIYYRDLTIQMNAWVRGGHKGKDFCHDISFGIPVGISYEYANICLDVRYYFGLKRMDVYEKPKAIYNRVLSITLGYKFKL